VTNCKTVSLNLYYKFIYLLHSVAMVAPQLMGTPHRMRHNKAGFTLIQVGVQVSFYRSFATHRSFTHMSEKFTIILAQYIVWLLCSVWLLIISTLNALWKMIILHYIHC